MLSGKEELSESKVGGVRVPEEGGGSVPLEQVVWKVIGGELGGVYYG